ncbi:DMT family transporter [Falsiroseomonas sp. CW058]|uniref:DMT family transporter n=1 Tax=Falsiroseomonas sp. CW058 TaxID=3388664 RepID=UPI003D31AE44
MAQRDEARHPAVAARVDDPLRGIALQMSAIGLFSVSDTMAKRLGESLPPVEIAWLRYLVFVTLAVMPLMRRGGLGVLRSRAPGLQVLRAVGVAGSAIFFILALRHLPLAEATAINFVSPAFITALSVVFLGEVVGWRRWSALCVGLLGALIVIRPGTDAFQVAALLPIASSAFWAMAAVVTRRMAGVDATTTTLAWTAGVGFLLLTLLLPFGVQVPTWPQLWLGLAIGLVSSVAQWLVVLAYRVAPASVLAPFSYVQLITSGLLGLVVFGAVPDRWTLVGALVIAASGLYTAHRERVRAQERR